MRRWLSLFLVCVAFIPAEKSMGAGIPEEALHRGLPLWEVTGQTPGGGTVWLLGSVHLRKTGRYDVDARINECFEQADALVVEADPLSAPENVAMLTGRYGFYLDGTSAADHLSPELFGKLPGAFESVGIPFGKEMRRARPWLLGLTLTVAQMQQCGFEETAGIDHIFLEKARRMEKKILSLESLEYQMGLFAGLSHRTQAALLADTVDEMGEVCEKTESVTDAWEKGNLERIEELMLKDLLEKEGLKAFYDTFITGRNLEMTGKIEKLAQNARKYFVVVGTAHLIGKEGIVNLLGKRGYSLRRLGRSKETVVMSGPGPPAAAGDTEAVTSFRGSSFSIDMPGKPASQDLAGEGGKAVGVMHMKQVSEDSFYTVSELWLPGEIAPERVREVFEKSLEGMTGFISNADVVMKELHQEDGLSVFRAEVVSENIRMSIKFILSQRAMYQLTVSHGGGTEKLPLSPGDYFQSFEIIEDSAR